MVERLLGWAQHGGRQARLPQAPRAVDDGRSHALAALELERKLGEVGARGTLSVERETRRASCRASTSTCDAMVEALAQRAAERGALHRRGQAASACAAVAPRRRRRSSPSPTTGRASPSTSRAGSSRSSTASVDPADPNVEGSGLGLADRPPHRARAPRAASPSTATSGEGAALHDLAAGRGDLATSRRPRQRRSRRGRDHPARRGRSVDLARAADEPRARGLPRRRRARRRGGAARCARAARPI